MKIRAIITGATGMVGEGVLLACLEHPEVEKVLVLNRRPGGVTHPKLTEILHDNFHDLSPIQEQLRGYNACFFCLGVSSVGMKEPEYHRLTYDLTLHVAQVLVGQNPEMTFCYVSGAGTDSTEQGRQMWARVKGKTENHLRRLPFRAVYAFRPGFLRATPGQKHIKSYYGALGWLYRPLRLVLPGFTTTLQEVALAMIHAATEGYPKPVLEVPDIVALAKR